MLRATIDLLFILNRYVHIICTTVIVGGTLFFEMIVPVATGAPRRSVSLAPRLAAAPSEGLRWGAFAYAPRTHLTVLLSGPTLVGRAWRAPCTVCFASSK